MTEPYAYPTPESRRVLYDRIVSHLENDGGVQISTYTKSTLYEKKHIKMFKVTQNGAWVQRGKKWDCIDYCSIRFGRWQKQENKP